MKQTHAQQITPNNEANRGQSMREDTKTTCQLFLLEGTPSSDLTGKHAYDLLCIKAREIDWPLLWRSDLTEHDAARLLVPDAPQCFCWSVRETGTWLYSGLYGDLRHLLYWELRCMWGSRFFAYDVGTLTELSFHEAISFVRQLEATCNNGAIDEGTKTAAPLHLLLQEAAQK